MSVRLPYSPALARSRRLSSVSFFTPQHADRPCVRVQRAPTMTASLTQLILPEQHARNHTLGCSVAAANGESRPVGSGDDGWMVEWEAQPGGTLH